MSSDDKTKQGSPGFKVVRQTGDDIIGLVGTTVKESNKDLVGRLRYVPPDVRPQYVCPAVVVHETVIDKAITREVCALRCDHEGSHVSPTGWMWSESSCAHSIRLSGDSVSIPIRIVFCEQPVGHEGAHVSRGRMEGDAGFAWAEDVPGNGITATVQQVKIKRATFPLPAVSLPQARTRKKPWWQRFRAAIGV